MIKKILLLTILLWSSSSYAATNWCNDANNLGCFLQEDSGSETDQGGNTSNDMAEVGGTMPQDADRKFGDFSRDFERGDIEWLQHADGLDTDISGADVQLTLVSWVKYESDTGSFQGLVTKYRSTIADRSYLLARESTNERPVCFLSSNGSDSTGNEVATSMTQGVWYHIACSYDDVTITTYLDGVASAAPTSYSSGLNDSGQAFKISCYNDSSCTDGLIDDVAIFDIAKDSTDINDMMDNGLVQVVTGPLKHPIITTGIF